MGRSRQSALEAFELNMEDADILLKLGKALTNERARKMRRELRERVGEALRLGKKDIDALDCVESEDFFVVLKPEASIRRQDLEDIRPLLRQAIVAACAAVENYVGDRVMELVGPALRSEDPPERLMDVTLTIGRWVEIDQRYQRKGWGLRQVIEEHVRIEASAEPMKIGVLFSTAGVPKIWGKVNGRAGRRLDTELDQIVDRRNRIAHQGDRRGGGRAALAFEDVEEALGLIREVIKHLEHVSQVAYAQ